jgi:Sec-independent protein translocase protein TatA
MHISLSELMLVLMVGLLILKPEQLPGAACWFGRLFKGIQQVVAKIQQEIQKPLGWALYKELPKKEPLQPLSPPQEDNSRL